MLENEKKISEIKVGDVVRLVVDGETTISRLMEGGRSGGCEYDLYMAFICWEGEDQDADDLPIVNTDQDEADECQISL